MGYYVSVIDHDRRGLLLGPFNRHGDAARMIHRVAIAAGGVDRHAAWYQYGTCHVDVGPLPAGCLNETLGFPADGTRLTLPDPPRYIVNPRVVVHGNGPPPPGYVRCDGTRDGCTTDPDDSHFHRLEAA